MSPAKPATFGALLRQYRVGAGLTQEDLAERARLSARVVSDLERGVTHSPRLYTVRQLADGLELAARDREEFEAAGRRAGSEAEAAAVARSAGDSSIQPAVSCPTNLPVQPTSLIGRQREIDQIAGLLRDPRIRLVTLTGPGGTGKTRLALQVGTLLHNYRDGVFLVSLSSLSNPALVPSAIVEALAIEGEVRKDVFESLVKYLQGKRLLLVLDNLEHLLAASPVVGSLLDSCRELDVLVTSRTPLHLSWEHEYPVPPLSIPDLKHLPDPAILSQFEAVELFVERAEAVKPGFALTGEVAPAVAELCCRLDGLPLAIELAAARIKIFPPHFILQRLSSSLTMLTGGARDRPARHHTLRGTIDWSYSLLSEEEQTLFARLSVFAGGCTFEAAEGVCNRERDLNLLEGLVSLAEQSLLRQVGDEEPRFVMLETIREYAAEKLMQSGEERQIREAHAQYFLGRVREAYPPDLRGAWIGVWVEHLEPEQDNLRAALGSLRDHGDPATGLELAAALSAFWLGRGRIVEGLDWLRSFLRACPEDSAVRGGALNGASFLAFRLGEYEQARRFTEESVRMARAHGDAQRLGRALGSLPRIMLADGNIDRALEITQEGIAIAQGTGDRNLLAFHLLTRAEAMRMAHRYSEARRLYQESLVLSRELGIMDGIVHNLHNLAQVELDEGNLDRAAVLLHEKAEVARQLRHAWIDSYTLLSFARLAAGRDEFDVAARLLAAANRMFDSRGVLLDPPEQAGYDSTLSLLRKRVPADELASLWEEGRAMSREQALAYAVQADSKLHAANPGMEVQDPHPGDSL